MKKYIIIFILLFIFFSVIYIHAECPAPFQKAKELALKVPKNEKGNHILQFLFNEDGIEFVIIFAYFPHSEIIGIGSNIDEMVYEYNEKTGELTVWTRWGRYRIENRDKEKFFEKAFQIFRKMVSKGLI